MDNSIKRTQNGKLPEAKNAMVVKPPYNGGSPQSFKIGELKDAQKPKR